MCKQFTPFEDQDMRKADETASLDAMENGLTAKNFLKEDWHSYRQTIFSVPVW